MANKDIALLKNSFGENYTDEEKLTTLGNNSGNLVFWNSIIRLFDPTIVSYREKEKLSNFKRVIITDLIWIREDAEYLYLEKIVDDCPDTIFIPMSVGLQASTFNPNFKLSDSLVRLLKKLEKKAILGVRGDYTASILSKYGITNYSVIGCPSMYYWNNPNLIISEDKKPVKCSSNFGTFYRRLSVPEKHFLTYCANKKMQFVEQTKNNFKLEHAADKNYFSYVNGWLEESSIIKYDYESWSESLKGIDFSMGGRFHGNVIALQNGIKSLFLTIDSRTKELTDYFRLPSMPMSAFSSNKSIDYYFKKANYKEFNKHYYLIFKNFEKFVSDNGLVFSPKATPLSFCTVVNNDEETEFEKINSITKYDYFKDNTVELKIKKQDNKITCEYVVNGVWDNCFLHNTEWFIEYEQNIENCPDSIAVIPFIANILPVAWLENATIIVDEIDEDFLYSIENLKNNYEYMLPGFDFKGSLKYNKVVKNTIDATYHKVLCLYSGGVDATATMLRNLKYKPTILTIWGTDIPLYKTDAWNKVKEANEKVAEEYHIPFTYLKSSFRNILDEVYLTQKYGKRINGNWWHEFQHGIALISLVAPYAYLNNFIDIKISSSFSAKDGQKTICASQPYIDENFTFANCSVYHDGYYLLRSDKIKYIVDYANRNNKEIKLRVCWQQVTGENCCVCEKCARTLYAILGMGGDPKKFGFELNEAQMSQLCQDAKNKKIGNSIFWDENKALLRKNRENQQYNELIKALLDD